jgi:hypothetical protein
MQMKSTRVGSFLGMVAVAGVYGCDKHRDEPPAQAQEPAAPAPTPAPPPAAPASASAAAEAPAPVVAKKPPEGVVPDRWVAGGRCNIENINGPAQPNAPFVVKSGTHVKVTGWALDAKGSKLPDAVHVRFSSPTEGDYYGTVTNRLIRDDVNRDYHVQPKDVKSGFELEFEADQLPPGSYSAILVIAVGDKTYVCDNGRKVTRE